MKKGGKSISRTLLVVLAGLLITSTGAMANDVDNNITGLGGTTFFGALHTDSDDFTDVFTFTIDGPVTVSASLVTIGDGLNNIDFVSANLNGNALSMSPNGFVEMGSTPIDLNLTGPLILTVTGKSGAAGGVFASYSGTMNVTSIPEPGTCALTLAALGMMALICHRRKAI